MRSIGHIINPFHCHPDSDLFTAQPITFQSMLNAKEKSKGLVNVELFTAQFAEDAEMVPVGFSPTPHLYKSVLNHHVFNETKKYPLLYDILERLYNASDADFLIYTNVDIGLYPDFYLKVNDFISSGPDAFIINRRRLREGFKRVSDLEQIYKEGGAGHPGFDCFVFHRSLFPKFILGSICIGVPFVEITFSQNLFAFSKCFKLYKNERITFHIGKEIFKRRAPNEYLVYNRLQFWSLVPQLWDHLDLKKFPFSHLWWPLRIVKWGLHPCIPIRLVLLLEFRALKTWLGIGP